jgi:hypothetical protein
VQQGGDATVMLGSYGPSVEQDGNRCDEFASARSAHTSNDPVGFLSLRLESTPAGVRATLRWNVDIEGSNHDQHLRSLDLDTAIRQVGSFIDEYMAGLSRR